MLNKAVKRLTRKFVSLMVMTIDDALIWAEKDAGEVDPNRGLKQRSS